MKSINDIDSMAVKLRRELGEDGMSPIDIFSIAKTQEDLTTVFYPLGENISGMCIKGKKSNLIAINSSMSLGRQRFSMAHEFFHLRYDEELINCVCSKNMNEGNEREKEADKFASHFLMPAAALYACLGDCNEMTLERVVWIEQHFGLSRQAILYRLKEEKKIDDELYKDMHQDVQKSAARLGYDTVLYKPTSTDENMKTIGKYIRLADQLANEEVISIGKYEELLLDAFRDDLVYGTNEEGDEIFD